MIVNSYKRIQASWSESEIAVERWLIRAIVLGILTRLLLLAGTYGSNDVFYWSQYGDSVLANGLFGAYDEYEFLNHPPLATLLVTGLRWIYQTTGIPFRSLLKLPTVLADLVAMGLLYRVWLPQGRRRALTVAAAYSITPLTILMSAYHGNTDTIYAVALLASAVFIGKRRGLLGGLAFAFAFNIKLIPLIAGPALLAAAWHRKQPLQFLAGAATGLLGFIPLALAEPDLLAHNILGYTPFPNQWGTDGIQSLLGESQFIEELANIHYTNTRLILLAATVTGLFVASRRGQRDTVRLAVWPAAAFIAFTPSIAPQHLILLAGLLYAAHLRWAIIWSIATSAYVIAVYSFYFLPDALLVSSFDGPVPNWIVTLGLVGLAVTALAGWKVSTAPPSNDPGASTAPQSS